MVRGIQEGAPHKIVGIDDSGNLGAGGRFYILTAIQFCTRRDYILWTKIVKRVIASDKKLRLDGEIKSSRMSPDLIKRTFQAIHKRDIQFNVWVYTIDTNHFAFVKDHIHNNKKGSKDKFFINILNAFLQDCISQSIQEFPITVEVDGRSKGSIKYKDALVEYKDSRSSYRLQFADFIGSAIYAHYEYPRADIYRPFYEKYVKSHILGSRHYPTQ